MRNVLQLLLLSKVAITQPDITTYNMKEFCAEDVVEMGLVISESKYL
jgi:hypothetical protein